MIIAIWIVSLLLIAEFIMAPINLWTGRTMPLFSKFTGFSPGTARRVFAPVKLTAAVLIAVGLALRPAGIAWRGDHYCRLRPVPRPPRRPGAGAMPQASWPSSSSARWRSRC